VPSSRRRCVSATRLGIGACRSFKQYDWLACADVYTNGTLPTGAVCTAAGQCVAGDVCYGSAASYACVPRLFVGRGAACGGSKDQDVECAPGLVCHPSGCEPWTPFDAEQGCEP